MYASECTVCFIEQPYARQPSNSCFSCGSVCRSAMICPNCFDSGLSATSAKIEQEQASSENEAIVHRERCASCNTIFPDVSDWSRSRVISLMFTGDNDLPWEDKYKKLYIDQRELLAELVGKFNKQFDQMILLSSRLKFFEEYFELPFYLYAYTNQYAAGLPVSGEQFGSSYFSFGRALTGSSRDDLLAFIRESNSYRLKWLAVVALIKTNQFTHAETFIFNLVFEKDYKFGSLALVEAASLCANWRYRPTLGLDDTSKHSWGRSKSLLDSASVTRLRPFVSHSNYGDWSLLAICQWLKAYPDVSAEELPTTKNLRSEKEALFNELDVRRSQNRGQGVTQKYLDFQISAAFLLGDIPFIEALKVDDDPMLRDQVSKYLLQRAQISSLRGDRIRKDFLAKSTEEQSKYLWGNLAHNEGPVKLSVAWDLLAFSSGKIRENLIHFIEQISYEQLTDTVDKHSVKPSALVLFDALLDPESKLSLEELLRFGVHLGRMTKFADCESMQKKLLSRTLTVWSTELSTPQSVLRLVESDDYRVRSSIIQAIIERSCEFGDLQGIRVLTQSRELRRHFAQMIREINSDLLPESVPALMELLSQMGSDEDPVTIKLIRENWLYDLFRSKQKGQVVTVLADSYMRPNGPRRSIIGLCGDRIFEVSGVLQSRGTNIWARPGEVISEAMRFPEFNLAEWVSLASKFFTAECFIDQYRSILDVVHAQVARDGADVLQAFKLLVEAFIRRIPELSVAVRRSEEKHLDESFKTLRSSLMASGTLSADEYRMTEIERIFADIKETLDADEAASKASSVSEVSEVDPSGVGRASAQEQEQQREQQRMAERAAAMEEQAKYMAESTRQMATQMAALAKYQADMAAAMARTDLSPLERAELIQKIVEDFQKKV